MYIIKIKKLNNSILHTHAFLHAHVQFLSGFDVQLSMILTYIYYWLDAETRATAAAESEELELQSHIDEPLKIQQQAE